ELGGARVHTAISGVAHYLAKNDDDCLARLRALVRELPAPPALGELHPALAPKRDPAELYHLLPEDHRQPYDTHAVLEAILDRGELDEFQPEHAAEMICGTARVEGFQVGVIANRRTMVKDDRGGPPRFGGIVYTES